MHHEQVDWMCSGHLAYLFSPAAIVLYETVP